MKNKDKYDLSKLSFVPKYRVNGCGKKIEGRCWVDVLYDGEAIERDIETTYTLVRFVLEWLER